MAPVFTAVITTMLAFTPFFFFEGMIGKFIWQEAVVVVAALLFSLIESFFILPAHLAHSKGLSSNKKTGRVRRAMDRGYQYLNRNIFGPALRIAMEYKFITISVPVFLLMVTWGLIKGEVVKSSSFPHIGRDNVNIDLTFTSGSQEARTDSILAVMEKKVWVLNAKLKKERKDGEDVVLYVTRTIGSNGLGDAGSHAGQLRLDLLPGDKRDMPAHVIGGMLRKMTGDIPGVQRVSFGGRGRWGMPVNISLLGDDLVQLESAKDLLKEKLKEYSTLKDVMDNDVQGRREISLSLLPKARALGLTLRDIAGQVRQGFFGQEIQRLQRGNDEIRIWVRYAPEDRISMGQLENMRIRTRTGEEYPFSELVEFSVDRNIVKVMHLDGKREIRVEADFEDPETAVKPIMDEIKATTVPEVLSSSEGVRVSYEGRARSDVKFARSAMKTFRLCLLGILIVLILVFRSYLQAILIFLMIPTGLIGAIFGHMFHGLLLSRLSTAGIIALSGIVINDSIVYIDQINRNLREGMKIKSAVFEAGLSRLRPILLTTATTVLGLSPLIFETSRQAKFLIPMAVSVAYGLLFGSVLILFVVPCLFLTLNNVRYYGRIAWYRVYSSITGKEREIDFTRESVEPAVKEVTREVSA
jgi:multidrug efflux pump subunit AcrB